MKAYAVFGKNGKIIFSTIKPKKERSEEVLLAYKKKGLKWGEEVDLTGYTVRPIEITEIKEGE